MCCHNFRQSACFMIFLCLIFLIDQLTYPYYYNHFPKVLVFQINLVIMRYLLMYLISMWRVKRSELKKFWLHCGIVLCVTVTKPENLPREFFDLGHAFYAFNDVNCNFYGLLGGRVTRYPLMKRHIFSWLFTKLDDFLPFVIYMVQWSLGNK